METTNPMPLLLRIEKARNALRFSLNQTCVAYDLPGYLIDLVLEGLLSEERGQRIALMAEQIMMEEKEDPDGEHHRSTE